MKKSVGWSLFALACLACTAACAAQPSSAPLQEQARQAMRKLADQPQIQQALAYIEKNEPTTHANTLAINAIPAPTFAEEKRARDIAARLTALGLSKVHVDAAGNVLGTIAGAGKGPTVALTAHMDTVYPLGTDLTVHERDGRLYAPGIADNARSLAAMLMVAQAMQAAAIKPEGDILFVANVGEEGLGDLKGIKHLIATHKEIKACVVLEPLMGNDTGTAITYLATGSRRFKISFKGPGGHSYEAFGLPSAIHAMGRAIARIDALQVPPDPKVTFNVGVIDGGQSVNTIASDASMLIDMRSENAAALATMEKDVMAAIAQAVTDTNQRWGSRAIAADINLVGDRPAGTMPVDAPIVQMALAASAVLGEPLSLGSAHSTDANLPISLGIPALTLSGGGAASGLHAAKTEWWSPLKAYRGPQQVLLTILGLAGYRGAGPVIGQPAHAVPRAAPPP